MGSSVEMIKKHYGHVNILKAVDHLKAGLLAIVQNRG
jgi:hypothetical protein